MTEPMKEIVFESLEWFLIVGSIISLIVGIALFINPEPIKKLNIPLNKWYSPRKPLKPFEIIRETDGYLYQKNKLFGYLTLVGSGFCLYVFLFNFPTAIFDEFQTYPFQVNALLLSIALETTKWFFIIVLIAGLPLLVLLIINPEKTKIISRFFNRWLSTRQMLSPLNRMHFNLDSIVFKYDKIFSIVFILCSVFILYVFLVIV